MPKDFTKFGEGKDDEHGATTPPAPTEEDLAELREQIRKEAEERQEIFRQMENVGKDEETNRWCRYCSGKIVRSFEKLPDTQRLEDIVFGPLTYPEDLNLDDLERRLARMRAEYRETLHCEQCQIVFFKLPE